MVHIHTHGVHSTLYIVYVPSTHDLSNTYIINIYRGQNVTYIYTYCA